MAETRNGETTFLYQHIYQTLKNEILEKKYESGGDFPPERLLKERFNTSHLTIRKALTKLVADGLIERYSGKGTVVVYAKPKNRITKIYCLVPVIDIDSMMFIDMMERELQRHDLQMVLQCYRSETPLAETMLMKAAEDKNSLTLCIPPGDLRVETITGVKGRTIFIGRRIEMDDICQIFSDDFKGGADAARLLLDLGYNRIACITSSMDFNGNEHIRGFLQEFIRAGLTKDDVYCVFGGRSVEGGAQACRTVLQNDIAYRAVFCDCQTAAMGVLKELKREGLIPGNDCSLIGFGDSPAVKAESITTVARDWESMVASITHILEQILTDGSVPFLNLSVPATITLRDSCVKAPGTTPSPGTNRH